MRPRPLMGPAVPAWLRMRPTAGSPLPAAPLLAASTQQASWVWRTELGEVAEVATKSRKRDRKEKKDKKDERKRSKRKEKEKHKKKRERDDG